MWNSLWAVIHCLAIKVESQPHFQTEGHSKRPTPNPAITQRQNNIPEGWRSSTQLINPPPDIWGRTTSQQFCRCCTGSSTDLKWLLHQAGSYWYGWRYIAVHLLINFNWAFSSCLRINLISLLKAIRITKKKARWIPLIYIVLPGTSS